MELFDTLPTQSLHIEHKHEGVWLKKSIMYKMTAMRTRHFFWLIFNWGYACAMKVHTWADQFLPQLLLVQFDTLPTQCRHIEHMHEKVCFQTN